MAYDALTNDPTYAGLSPRSRLIATYSLCGFGNIGSLGTQIGMHAQHIRLLPDTSVLTLIGVLSQIAPTRGGDVSRLALSALLTGILATLSSASIAGLVVQDQAAFV